MKKITKICSLLVGLLILTGCSKTKTLSIKDPHVVPNGFEDRFQSVSQASSELMVWASSPSELKSASDLIVVFTPDSQRNVVLTFEDGLEASGYTETTGKVEMVLQGDATTGDTIMITEECYISNSSDTLTSLGGYLPMKIGERYLLFLKEYPEGYEPYVGMYCPIDQEHGKYALTADTIPASADAETYLASYEVNGYTDLNEYREWYAYVRELYPELF